MSQNTARASKIFFNDDGQTPYYRAEPGTATPVLMDESLDALTSSQVRIFLFCINGKKTYFPNSKAWETYIEGFDPHAGPHQPFFDGDTYDWFYRLAMNMAALFDQGIDPPAYIFERARANGMEPWITMRMNDGHARGQPNHPLSSKFYREHPEYLTEGLAWDYALSPVREHMMALILELLERYDVDGLELDWNRSPHHFRDGHFEQGGRVLTQWIREVHEAIESAAAKRGHRIELSARVPSLPEVAAGIGLDVVTWARCSLVDWLVVGPYKGTTDFDVPVEEWKRLVDSSGVPVTVCLEHVVAFIPGCPNCWSPGGRCMNAEQLRGAAIGALHRGADGIYLFNQMDRQLEQPELFHELGAIETLEDKDRDYVQTYANPEIPGRPLIHALPRNIPTGGTTTFKLYIGPKPIAGAQCTVLLTTPDGD